MTTITAEHEGNHYKLELKGHTETRLCAGISTLLCTLNAVLASDDEVSALKAELKPGDSYIEFDSSGKGAHDSMVFVLIGVMLMEHNYPDKIKIKKSFPF